MRRAVLALMVSGCLSAAMSAAGLQATQGSRPAAPASGSAAAAAAPAAVSPAGEVILVGCVAKGTAANSFILQYGRANELAPTAQGRTYSLVAPATSAIQFSKFVGHRVTVTGRVTKPAGTGAAATPAELTASIVLPISNVCP